MPTYRSGPFNLVVILVLLLTGWMLLQQWQSVDEIRWDEFVNHVESKHISSVTLKETEIVGKFNEAGLASRGEKSKVSFVVYYKPEVHGERLERLLEENGVGPDIPAEYRQFTRRVHRENPLTVRGKKMGTAELIALIHAKMRDDDYLDVFENVYGWFEQTRKKLIPS